MSARAIDYLKNTESVGSPLPAREQIDLDSAVLGGERSTKQIADDLGLSTRTVTRRRAELRTRGFAVRVPEPEFDDVRRDKLANRMRSLRVRQ